MMKSYVVNSPYGITAIQLVNGDEAFYLHGEFVACADMAERDDSVIPLAEHLASVMGVPFQLLECPVPDNEEWAWNDVVASLGWGKSISLSGMQLRPVLECCISHITGDDQLLFSVISCEKSESYWIIDTDIGYLIRLDARVRPLLKLKQLGVSRTTRKLINQYMKQANISMIHFSQVGDELEGSPLFDW